jgi:hypothetical protein
VPSSGVQALNKKKSAKREIIFFINDKDFDVMMLNTNIGCVKVKKNPKFFGF